MNEEKELRIPKDLFEKLEAAQKDISGTALTEAIKDILCSQAFQMLNDYPIPIQYCLHLRQIVYPDKEKGGYNPYQCLNCKEYF